jgi:hypothetical protein
MLTLMGAALGGIGDLWTYSVRNSHFGGHRRL